MTLLGELLLDEKTIQRAQQQLRVRVHAPGNGIVHVEAVEQSEIGPGPRLGLQRAGIDCDHVVGAVSDAEEQRVKRRVLGKSAGTNARVACAEAFDGLPYRGVLAHGDLASHEIGGAEYSTVGARNELVSGRVHRHGEGYLALA